MNTQSGIGLEVASVTIRSDDRHEVRQAGFTVLSPRLCLQPAVGVRATFSISGTATGALDVPGKRNGGP